MRRYRLIFFCCACLLGVNFARAQESARLVNGWEFLKGGIGSSWEAVRPVKEGSPESVPLWEKVTLPHCFNARDAVDPGLNYYQGPGWYRTNLTIENPYKNGRTLLHFEGAGQKTEVYVYTQKVGSHTGGYDEWTVDITDAVKAFLKEEDSKRFKGKIPISIRCDNSRDAEMIPSSMSDFNVYGGLYRYVDLQYAPALSLNYLHINATVDTAGKSGKAEVSLSFYNPSSVNHASVAISIVDSKGKTVKNFSKAITPWQGENEIFSFGIDKPELWSPDHPALYTLQAKIVTAGGREIKQYHFGFRHFEFITHGPFMLNGKRLLLRGTHRHEDAAGMGAAETEDMIRREFILMKNMGINFIRLAHYQQSPIVLRMCDSLGILAWEEIP
ncbi:MAG TPA: glycoside hydrolase family 2 TIM barrel-domain containing protein, partial [Chitinophagaceae bacterium]